MAKEVIAVNLPKDRELDIDYDEGADVLYISFGKPQPADDSERCYLQIPRERTNWNHRPQFQIKNGASQNLAS
jgi:hypothetical protein